MLGLTSSALFWLTILLTIAVPLAAVWFWRRGQGSVLAMVRNLVLIGVSQLLAVLTAFLWMNNQYGFYTSWADIFGGNTNIAAIQVNGFANNGNGTLKVITIHGKAATAQTLVWLPPQYNSPRYAHHKFPVVMFLTGQPSSPVVAFKNFNFGPTATQEIASGRVKPFVAVFPPLMISPPRDTECTNVPPHGPKAENWLAYDVPNAIKQQFRVDRSGKQWSAMGWSTGGFCSAKLVIAHVNTIAAAVGFGAYYQPIMDHTTGRLFDGKAIIRDHNSPEWLYNRHGLMGNHLLMITGKQDREAWRSTRKMLQATKGDPNVNYIAFPNGGHNYHNYAAYLGVALTWLNKVGAAG